jgi:protein N-terminal methyltransferase
MSKSQLYKNIENRWNQTEASISGVLGGFEELNENDIDASCEVLQNLIENNEIYTGKALDCCAGIGRVTQNVLQHYFEEIDMFDQEQRFVNQARINLFGNGKVGKIIKSSLQEFYTNEKYDVIWMQWSLENLEEEDAKEFLNRCHDFLYDDGVIILKENVTKLEDVYHGADCVIRSRETLCKIFWECGYNVLKGFEAKNWPEGLFGVETYVLKKR